MRFDELRASGNANEITRGFPHAELVAAWGGRLEFQEACW